MDHVRRIAVIPAYEPGAEMLTTAAELKENGLEILIVDDGSGDDYTDLFRRAGTYTHVIHHDVNKGKGAALKTGFRCVKSLFDPPYTIVTVDADGQHKTADVLRVCEAAEQNRDALTIGSRKFDGHVPLRSRFGNAVTRLVFALSIKKRVYDTQTGLRAFSENLTDKMLDISGERYEYEMNMLMVLAGENIPINEVRIETVYLNDNASSHFDTLRDSWRVYKEILRFSGSSLICFCIDYLLYCALLALSGIVVFSNVAARIVSAAINYTLNRKVVFKSRTSVLGSALKYFGLAVFILLCNTLLLKMLTAAGLNVYLAKIPVELAMSFFSWLIQHKFIFNTPKAKDPMPETDGIQAVPDIAGNGENMKKNHKWAIVFSTCLIAFTTYLMLDTFLLSRTYQENVTGMNLDMFNVDSESENQAISGSIIPDGTDTQGASSEETSGSKPKNGAASEEASGNSSTSVEDKTGSVSGRASGRRPGNVASSERPSGSRPGKRAASDGQISENSAANRDFTDASANKESKRKQSTSADAATDSTRSDDDRTSNLETGNLTPVSGGKTGSYTDSNISIMLNEYEYLDTHVYVADVRLSSAVYLKTAFANNTYGKNVTARTSEMAEENNAILAINGDYYGARNEGVVIRNGVVYRESDADEDILCIYADGSFKIADPDDVTAEELVKDGVWQAFSFGPGLIENGEISVSENDEVGKAKASNPRTAIGMIDKLHYVFVVADGRTDESAGLSLSGLAEFMKEMGVKTAYNLDGGGSSTMVFNNEIINNPTTNGSIKERKVSDIVYIG